LNERSTASTEAVRRWFDLAVRELRASADIPAADGLLGLRASGRTGCWSAGGSSRKAHRAYRTDSLGHLGISGVHLELDPQSLQELVEPLRPAAELLGADPLEWVLAPCLRQPRACRDGAHGPQLPAGDLIQDGILPGAVVGRWLEVIWAGASRSP
jgi:hypothetical protein